MEKTDMRKVFYIILTAVITGIAGAQETRKEFTSPPSRYDTLANSDSVPEVYAIEARFERVVVLRLKYGTDLLEGIEKWTKGNGIRNAVIIAGTGSVTSFHYHAISNLGFPTRNIFVRNDSSPADIVSMNGYIVNGRVHTHVTFTHADKAFGGHLEQGTGVFTFAIVTLGVLPDTADLSRIDDKNYR